MNPLALEKNLVLAETVITVVLPRNENKMGITKESVIVIILPNNESGMTITSVCNKGEAAPQSDQKQGGNKMNKLVIVSTFIEAAKVAKTGAKESKKVMKKADSPAKKEEAKKELDANNLLVKENKKLVEIAKNTLEIVNNTVLYVKELESKINVLEASTFETKNMRDGRINIIKELVARKDEFGIKEGMKPVKVVKTKRKAEIKEATTEITIGKNWDQFDELIMDIQTAAKIKIAEYLTNEMNVGGKGLGRQAKISTLIGIYENLRSSGIGTAKKNTTRSSLVIGEENFMSTAKAMHVNAGKKLELTEFPTLNLDLNNRRDHVNNLGKKLVLAANKTIKKIGKTGLSVMTHNQYVVFNYKENGASKEMGNLELLDHKGTKYLVSTIEGESSVYAGKSTGINGKTNVMNAFVDQIVDQAISWADALNAGNGYAIKLYPGAKADKRMDKVSPISYLCKKEELQYLHATQLARANTIALTAEELKNPDNAGLIGGSYTSANGTMKKLTSVKEIRNVLVNKEVYQMSEVEKGTLDIILDPERSFKATRVNAENSLHATTTGAVTLSVKNVLDTNKTWSSTPGNRKLVVSAQFVNEDGTLSQESKILMVNGNGEHKDLYVDYKLDGREYSEEMAKYNSAMILEKSLKTDENPEGRTAEEITEIRNSANKTRTYSLKSKTYVNKNIGKFELEDKEIEKVIKKHCGGFVPGILANVVNKKEGAIAGFEHNQFIKSVKSGKGFDGNFTFDSKQEVEEYDVLKEGLRGTVTDMDGVKHPVVMTITTLSIDASKYSYIDNGKGHTDETRWNHQGVSVLKATLGTAAAEEISLEDAETIAKNLAIFGYETVMGRITNVQDRTKNVSIELNEPIYKLLFENERPRGTQAPDHYGQEFIKSWEGLVRIIVKDEIKLISKELKEGEVVTWETVSAKQSEGDLFWMYQDGYLNIKTVVADKDGKIKMLRQSGSIRKSAVGNFMPFSYLRKTLTVMQNLLGKNIDPEDAKNILNLETLSAKDAKTLKLCFNELSEVESVEIYPNRYITTEKKFIKSALPIDFNAIYKFANLVELMSRDLDAWTEKDLERDTDGIQARKVRSVLDAISSNMRIKNDDIIKMVEELGGEDMMMSDSDNRRTIAESMSFLRSKVYRGKDKVFSKKSKEIFGKKFKTTAYGTALTVKGIEKGTVVISSYYKSKFNANDLESVYALLLRYPLTGSAAAGVKIIFSDNVQKNVVLCNYVDWAWLMGDVDGDLVTLIASTETIVNKFKALQPKGMVQTLDKFFRDRAIKETVWKAPALDFSVEACIERQKTFFASVQPQFQATGIVSAGLMKQVCMLNEIGINLSMTRSYQLEVVKQLSQIPIAAKNTSYSKAKDGEVVKTTSQKLQEMASNYGRTFDVDEAIAMQKLANAR